MQKLENLLLCKTKDNMPFLIKKTRILCIILIKYNNCIIHSISKPSSIDFKAIRWLCTIYLYYKAVLWQFDKLFWNWTGTQIRTFLIKKSVDLIKKSTVLCFEFYLHTNCINRIHVTIYLSKYTCSNVSFFCALNIVLLPKFGKLGIGSA